jgi:hypothetical protein
MRCITNAIYMYLPSVSLNCSTTLPFSSMRITTDHQTLTAALKQLDIKPDDYYLMFDSDTSAVYIVWCTTSANAMRILEEETCVDLDVTNDQDWLSYEELPPGYQPKRPLVCLRYILETN